MESGYIMPEKPRSQAEARHEAFEREAVIARELSGRALDSIDSALADYDLCIEGMRTVIEQELVDNNAIEPAQD